MRKKSLVTIGGIIALASPAVAQEQPPPGQYDPEEHGGLPMWGNGWIPEQPGQQVPNQPGQPYYGAESTAVGIVSAQPYSLDEPARFAFELASSGLPVEDSIPAKGTRGAGYIVSARQIPAAPPSGSSSPSSVHYLAQIRNDEFEVASDPGTYVFLDWAKRLAPRHGHGEDYRVKSCAGYVYKRWYEYGRFEDAARTCGTDASCVFAIGTTWSSPGISSRPQLFQKAPGIHTIPSPLRPRSEDVVAGAMWAPFEVKNAFFRVAPAGVLRASTQYANDPTFASDTESLIPVVGTPPLYDVTNKMQWHVAMAARQEPLGLTRVERKDIGRRLTRYRRLADEYRTLRARLPDADLPEIMVDAPGLAGDVSREDSSWSSTVSFLGGSIDDTGLSDPLPETVTTGLSPEAVTAIAYQAVVDEMAEYLMYEWRHRNVRDRVTLDHGCLVGVACDWLPEMFVDDYVGRFQSEREADMQRCLQATSDVIPDDAGWAADVVTMTAHIESELAKLTELVASLPFVDDPAEAAYRGSRVIRWGISPVYESKGIRDLLHAEYDHHATAELAVNFSGGKVCSLSAQVDAGIYAAYTAPNPDLGYYPQTHTMLDGNLMLTVARDGKAFEAQTHMIVADQQVFRFAPSIPITGDTWSAPPQTTHFAIYNYHLPFSILGIPAFLSVAIQGDLGFEPSITVPAFDDSCSRDLVAHPELAPVIEGALVSNVNVDADGTLAIGIPGFSFGVNGHIDVLTASVPAKARFSVVSDGGVPKLALDALARLDAVLLGGSLSVYAEALFVYAEQSVFGWEGIHVGFDLWKTQAKVPLTFLSTAFKVPAPAGGDS